MRLNWRKNPAEGEHGELSQSFFSKAPLLPIWGYKRSYHTFYNQEAICSQAIPDHDGTTVSSQTMSQRKPPPPLCQVLGLLCFVGMTQEVIHETLSGDPLWHYPVRACSDGFPDKLLRGAFHITFVRFLELLYDSSVAKRS